MLKTCLTILYTTTIIFSAFTTSLINAEANPVIIVSTSLHLDNLRKLSSNLQLPENQARFKVFRTSEFPHEIETPENIAIQENWFLRINNTFQIDENTILIADSTGTPAAIRIAETHKVFGIVLIYPIESGLSPYIFNWNSVKSNAKWIMQFSLKSDAGIPYETEQLPVANRLAGDNFKLHYYMSNDETIENKIMSDIVVCIAEKQDSIDHPHVIVQAQTTIPTNKITIPTTPIHVASTSPTTTTTTTTTISSSSPSSSSTISPSTSSPSTSTSTIITSSPTSTTIKPTTTTTAVDDSNIPTINFDWNPITTIQPTGLIPKTAAVSSTSPTPDTNTYTNINSNNPDADTYTIPSSSFSSTSGASKNTFQLASLQLLVFIMILWSSLLLLL